MSSDSVFASAAVSVAVFASAADSVAASEAMLELNRRAVASEVENLMILT